MNSPVYLYGDILEKTVQPGTGGAPVAVLVTGKVTGHGVDLDDQIVDPDWAKAALGEWFKRAGNIREMHRKDSAVGKALDLQPSADGDGFDVTARISDESAMRKVLDGVYAGFSIGIKRRLSDPPIVIPDRVAKGGRIRAGLIHEISLVDAPAYPDARVNNVEALWKMAGGETDELADDEPETEIEAEDAEKAVDGETVAATESTDADVTKATDPDSDRKSPPKGYPQDKGEYADPERFGYPVDSAARTRSAMAYYNAGKGKGQQGRTASDWASIGRKIVSAANKFFGSGHRLEGDQIVSGGSDEKNKYLKETLEGAIPVLVGGDNQPVLGNMRWITKADGSMTAVGPDMSYAPFPTEGRNGFGDPPDPAPAGFPEADDSIANKGTLPERPNGQSVRPGPNDASHFQPLSNPDTPSVPAEFTPTPANNLAGGSGGFSHQTPAELAKALTDEIETALSDPDIQKNGVARNLGPTAKSLIYNMLTSEVEEDGGTGSCACDIGHIAGAYDKLVCFITSELSEPEEMGMGKVVEDRFGAAKSLLALASYLDPDIADDIDAIRKNIDGTDDPAELVKTLRAEIDRLTEENEALNKQLDATPVDDGPMKTLLAVDEANTAKVRRDQASAVLARWADEREPRAKAALWSQYMDLSTTS